MQKDSSILFSSGEFQVELCITPQELEAALAARARFYESVEDLSVPPHGDEFDHQINAKVFVVKREGEILGTIRNLAYNQAYDWSPCVTTQYWPEVADALGGDRIPKLESNGFAVQKGYPISLPLFEGENLSIIELSRFATASNLDKKTSLSVLGLLFRSQAISTIAENVAYSSAMVRPHHTRFYTKNMKMYPMISGIWIYGIETNLVVGSAPTECTFPYSLPEILGIDMDACVERYKVLKQRLLASFIPKKTS